MKNGINLQESSVFLFEAFLSDLCGFSSAASPVKGFCVRSRTKFAHDSRRVLLAV